MIARLSGTEDGVCLNMLVDGGASHSFIKLDALTDQVKSQIVQNHGELGMIAKQFRVNTANNSIIAWLGVI